MNKETQVRLALINTPRVGNTWLRAMLAMLYDLHEVAVHNPTHVNWDQLPDRMILQLHWHRTEPLTSLLNAYSFKRIVLVRHPLDTLISILHFSPNRTSETSRWLEGECGDEREIMGVAPRSSAFLKYASGRRAQALLSISPEWWTTPRICRVRYEELVTDTPGQLERIVQEIGREPLMPIQEAVESAAIDQMRVTSRAHLVHMWRGKPGHWRELLPAEEANQIYLAHANVFQKTGYTCAPSEKLSSAQADANWYRLEAETRMRDFRKLWDMFEEMERRHEIEINDLRKCLALADALRPTALAVARRLHQLAARFPRLATCMKRCVPPPFRSRLSGG